MIDVKVAGEDSIDAAQIVTGRLEILEVPLEVVLKTRVHEHAGIAAADQVDGFNGVGAVDTGQGIPDPATQPKPVSQMRSDGFGIADIGTRAARSTLLLSREGRAWRRRPFQSGGNFVDGWVDFVVAWREFYHHPSAIQPAPSQCPEPEI